MQDTRHSPGEVHEGPTAVDGVNYRGIVWFLVVLVGTVVVSQIAMWLMFRLFQHQRVVNDAPTTALAVPFGQDTPDCGAQMGKPTGPFSRPCMTENGELAPGRPMAGPNLMVIDPLGLQKFREKEDAALSGDSAYAVLDKNTGVYRIPIDRAKELILQRGIPGGVNAPAAPVKK